MTQPRHQAAVRTGRDRAQLPHSLSVASRVMILSSIPELNRTVCLTVAIKIYSYRCPGKYSNA
jgi:hypothetical protein